MSVIGQVATHLLEELFRGTWTTWLPGVHALAAALGSNHKTVETALRQLEREGLLVPQGPGRRRRSAVPDDQAAHPLRVAILDCEPQILRGQTHARVRNLTFENLTLAGKPVRDPEYSKRTSS